jgi:Flp pilus assembly protein TadD
MIVMTHPVKGKAMPPHSDLVNELLQRGNDLLKQGLYQDALPVLEQACQLAPSSARAHTLRGVALQCLKRKRETVIAFEQAIQLDASPAITWYLMASMKPQNSCSPPQI